MKWTKRLKRRLKTFGVGKEEKPWRYGHGTAENYEERGDLALYRHKGNTAVKYYDKALDKLSTEISKQKRMIEKSNRDGRYKEQIGYERAIDDQTHLDKMRDKYERIQRKHDRIEASLSGKRKYLSGKGREHHNESGLASKVAGVVGIIGFVGAMTFAYPSITGNAIGNLTTINSDVLAFILFLLGIVGAFIFFKYR